MLAKIKNNTIKASNITLNPSDYIPPKVVLNDIRVSYKSENGKKTDEIETVRYDVINPDTFETFTIKVDGSAPVISPENFDTEEKKIYIEIPVDKVIIKPYKIEYGVVYLSITAPNVKIIK